MTTDIKDSSSLILLFHIKDRTNQLEGWYSCGLIKMGGSNNSSLWRPFEYYCHQSILCLKTKVNRINEEKQQWTILNYSVTSSEREDQIIKRQGDK